jgi:immunity protein, SdpI family
MKLSWRTELPQLVLIAAMFALAAWSWSRLPDQIPTHWDLQGQVNGHGNKFVGLLLLPLTALGLYLLTMLLPLADPGGANYKNFAGAYNTIRLGTLAQLGLIYAAAVAAAFGRHVDITQIAFLGVGVLFMLLGNVMGKIRPNWFVGVRTPWTLSSKLSWDKTHRLTGWLMMFMGVLFVVVAFVHTTWTFAAMLIIDAACLGWSVIYSYLVYRDDPNRTSPAGTSPGTDS